MAVRQRAGVLRSLVDGNLTRWSAKSICFRSSGGFRLFSSLFLMHIPIAHLFVTFAERDSRRAAAPSQIWEPRSRGAVCFLWLHTWKPQIDPERNGMKGSSLWEKKKKNKKQKTKNSEEEKPGRKGPRGVNFGMSFWVRAARVCELCSLCTPAAFTWGMGLLLVGKVELETVTPLKKVRSGNFLLLSESVPSVFFACEEKNWECCQLATETQRLPSSDVVYK